MSYKTTHDCIQDLEAHGHLIRIKQEVDPYLEMAAIQRRVYEAGGPAIYFENIKGCKYPAVSNLFGSMERSRFMFRESMPKVQKLMRLKADPTQIMKKPFSFLNMPSLGMTALPKKVSKSKLKDFDLISIDQLPLIHSWPMDGGAFVTLPIVYTEDIETPGVMKSNLGMYRIQLNGNDYQTNQEIGLHYQLHRGIGVHQTKANAKGVPLKVSIFVGGHPAHTLSAVMPLPEGIPEVTFAGAMANRRFRYTIDDGYVVSTDADFVITGEVYPMENKPEGPFGDHLGYYSLVHDFPLMRVHKVYARKENAIWPFTVVGRPPQEDTSFGALIHDITGPVIPSELPGLHAVNAVDAAGVHPLLLAIGSERYTPYVSERKPQEILTIANHILGFGQMSLAKYLFIIAKEDNTRLDIHDIKAYFQHVLERVDWTRDLHFQTKTSIDTLDYSGEDLNSGSKVVIAAAGDIKRTLGTELKSELVLDDGFQNPQVVIPGIIAIKGPKYVSDIIAQSEMARLSASLATNGLEPLQEWPLVLVVDDAEFTAQTLNNFLWVTFTRSNPSHDIHGVDSFTKHKHWGCNGPLIIDARIKPHHAPPLIDDPAITAKVDALGAVGGPLHGII